MAGTALIVVDMQNGFIEPVKGSGVPGAAGVLDAVNARVRDAAEHGWPVFYTRDVDPFGDGPQSPDTLLHKDLRVAGTVVDKGPGSSAGFSGFVLAGAARGGFAGTGGLSELAGLLRAADIDQVVVVGLAADVCVSATARDARRLGYGVTVDLAASAFVHAHPDGDAAAVAELRAAAVEVR